MCDKETKVNFRIIQLIGGIMFIAMSWGAWQIYEMHSKVDSFAAFIESIPPGFFYKKRYGDDDATRDKLHYEQLIEVLDKRLQVLEREVESHNREAEIWKDIIRDTAKTMRECEKGIWNIEKRGSK